MEYKKISFRERLKSFSFAYAGLKFLFKSEHNAWLHVSAAVFVGIAGYVLNVNKLEAITLIFSIAFVFVAEIFNTAIEKTMDFISMEKNSKIAIIKDLSAAAVLISSIASIMIGCIIFLPKIFQ